jgi:glycosyltransferase involved in cell wall biosynthesis
VGISPLKVTTIHNGVDTQKFAPLHEAQRAKSRGQSAEGSRQEAAGRAERVAQSAGRLSVVRSPQSALCALRQTLGLPVDGILIGTVGRLDPVKDHSSLLRAFAPLARVGEPARLVIVGEGQMRGEIETQIRELEIGDRVQMLGERQDVSEVLKAFDVFTLPSIAEGISNTILEAMASGLPVVATRVGGNVELVEDGASGRLVDSKDVPALTAALESYIRAPQLRIQHGSAGRARAEKKFSLDRMAAQYAALYRNVLGKGHRI